MRTNCKKLMSQFKIRRSCYLLLIVLDKEKVQVPSDEGDVDFDNGSSAGKNNNGRKVTV